MTTKKEQRRIKIKFRIRKSVNGTAERPRLSVFRSNKQIYAQVINDLTGYLYHGRVQALADAAREGGLKF